MPFGLPWSEQFIEQLADPEDRREFMRDQVRTRFALLIRALREQEDRQWSQTELGRQMGKPQSVISRIEDPDYGKLSLETMFEVAEAFGLPLWIDLPEWDDWFRVIRNVEASRLHRESFDAQKLIVQARAAEAAAARTSIAQIGSRGPGTAVNDDRALESLQDHQLTGRRTTAIVGA
jgi:transcriptional regulator with XRE-family HTH domain